MDLKESLLKNDKQGFVEACNARYLSEFEIRKRIPRHWDVSQLLTEVYRWRYSRSIVLPLLNQEGKGFWFCQTPFIQKAQSLMDQYGYDTLFENVPERAIRKIEKDNLLEEAFYSSQIEGAKTTRRRAEEMIRNNAQPRSRSERETLNNYRAMEHILSNADQEISIRMIQNLHRIVTDGALDFGVPGAFRTEADETVVGNILEDDYVPPAPEKMKVFLESFIEWINTSSYGSQSIHPVIKASILHFYFVYLHPFPDGNGRTARALYYFYLNKHYNAMPYLSISHVIGKKRRAYDQSILDVEKQGTDLTFFIHYSCEITTEAIDNLRFMVEHYSAANRLEKVLGERSLELNKRQNQILRYLLRPDIAYVDLKKYQKLYKIVYETARNDLQSLEEKGFLVSKKIGKKFIYQLKKENES